jgi:hypothetical protein
MTDEEHLKLRRKKKARRIQKETGVNYTTALRQVIAAENEENN